MKHKAFENPEYLIHVYERKKARPTHLQQWYEAHGIENTQYLILVNDSKRQD